MFAACKRGCSSIACPRVRTRRVAPWCGWLAVELAHDLTEEPFAECDVLRRRGEGEQFTTPAELVGLGERRDASRVRPAPAVSGGTSISMSMCGSPRLIASASSSVRRNDSVENCRRCRSTTSSNRAGTSCLCTVVGKLDQRELAHQLLVMLIGLEHEMHRGVDETAPASSFGLTTSPRSCWCSGRGDRKVDLAPHFLASLGAIHAPGTRELFNERDAATGRGVDAVAPLDGRFVGAVADTQDDATRRDVDDQHDVGTGMEHGVRYELGDE